MLLICCLFFMPTTARYCLLFKILSTSSFDCLQDHFLPLWGSFCYSRYQYSPFMVNILCSLIEFSTTFFSWVNLSDVIVHLNLPSKEVVERLKFSTVCCICEVMAYLIAVLSAASGGVVLSFLLLSWSSLPSHWGSIEWHFFWQPAKLTGLGEYPGNGLLMLPRLLDQLYMV